MYIYIQFFLYDIYSVDHLIMLGLSGYAGCICIMPQFLMVVQIQFLIFFKCPASHFGFGKYFILNLNLNFVVGNILLLFSTHPTIHYVISVLFQATSHGSIDNITV